ncbi:type I restriction enzyme, R subunit [Hathewaya proteolytica DSM 3090]|uniref:Type I restriction enzyme, R subunit n=1 Tax=Hathewaya proteolytica DSM 3090 TaxID=1121331 RepID=A0A1M6NN49_9CLOT|nr:type I restriction endonuclease [Hathewaya proteolytica]SHJ97113.1 type I restriction enzyme, R subunit [Hathewaya proteolytica DSM 3090]
MAIQTKEITFENEIEYSLINHGGYIKGNPRDYNREYALDTALLFRFLKDSQPKEWKKLEQKYGVHTEANFLKRLNKELDSKGMLHILRHGVIDAPAKFDLCYFPPASSMNQTSTELYQKNILSITRQVHYSLKNENSIDVVLFVNGLPFATLELKNQITGQTVDNAKRQYMKDRDPRELLLSFKARCLVHFAVDTDEVWMTTKLNNIDTYFLPFNKGKNGGKGNPIGDGTYRTSYLWDEVLQKDSILDIIQRFIHLQANGRKENLIFPRYHQLDVVRKLITDVKESGTGNNYLIQHSAGSGKSNSIAWLAHHLSNLHDNDDKVIFNSIIVITDRLVLDKQLQDTIYQFEHVDGVVIKIDNNSTQLANALNTGKKIIITTLQKFPFILEKVNGLEGKRFAVIVDEAHSSQTGEASRKMKAILGNTDGVSEDEYYQKIAEEEAREENNLTDSEDEILKEMSTHGKLSNLSFFAFTATPKAKTLEMFGTADSNGIPQSFHIYSMKQAIEEGFIHDVLKNYMTYETYFKIGKMVSDDPRYEKSKANKALGKYLSLHPHNLAQKTQIMIEHFRTVTKDKIGGRAKAMVVTGSRLHAVRYYKEFEKYIKKMGYEKELGILIAFSGTVHDGGEDYTEVSMNKFPETELPERFSSGEYQVLLVAEKYQTGFDEPLLHTMFVDKKLSGVKAVQTLSRLNRTCFGKEDTFILDFVNSVDDIREAFQPYYEQTTIEEVTDANIVYDLKSKLDEFRVYWDSEVNAFSKVFFKPTKKQGNLDFGALNNYLDPAVDRFKALADNEQEEFKSTLTKFVRTYSFVSGIVRLDDRDMHKFFAYGKCLLKKLPKKGEVSQLFLDEEVSLQYYRVQKIFEGAIELKESEALYNSMHVGKPKAEEEKAPLSELVDKLNDKFGTDFTKEDMLIVEQFISDMDKNEELRTQACNNSAEHFKYPFNDAFMNIVIDRMVQNQSFCERVLDDEKFGNTVKDLLVDVVYDRLRQAQI